MGIEVTREPSIQPPREFRTFDVLVALETVHDIANFVKQALVIAFVLSQLIVAVLAHELFFKRKMRRNALEQIAEETGSRQLCGFLRKWVSPSPKFRG